MLPGNVTNEEAWQHGRLLVVGTHQYIIDLNPPIVDKVNSNKSRAAVFLKHSLWLLVLPGAGSGAGAGAGAA